MEDNDDLDFVAVEHDRLISAVAKLDKTQHITAPTRNEPTNLNTEFNLIKRSNKLNLLNAVKLLEDTASHVQISKKLKATQNKSQVLPKPLEKPQVERIKRETGYVEAKKKIGRWDAVVARSRTVDFVSFPLKTLQTKEKHQPTKNFLSKLILKSPLEKELEEVDPPVFAEEEEEDEKSFPMTYQEMLEHRQHLAKLRAKESYKASKAKRQSKIKSKKYHRILKKERLKQQLKEFEELQVKNPEEALKKLEELEKVRALERHTLRHKNTGKWAKSKLVRAKYDKEVRQQLAEQLSVSRSLTHKTQDTASTDDEADDDNQVIPDLPLSQDPLNPWMLKRSDKSNIDEEFNFGYKNYLKEKIYKRKEQSETESDSENANDNITWEDKTESLLHILKNGVSNMSAKGVAEKAEVSSEETKEVSTNTNKHKKQKTGKPIATTTWTVSDLYNTDSDLKTSEDISEAFESFENNVAQKVEEKLHKLRKDIESIENMSRKSVKENPRKRVAPKDNVEYLKLKNQKVKAIIDEELIETNKNNTKEIFHKEDNQVNHIKDLQAVSAGTEQERTDSNIDPSRFLEVKPKYLNTSLSKGENYVDQLDDDEQVVPKVDIEEVFEEDDVVASFKQEKEDEINKDKADEIVLTLPGWGSWGGKGVKAPKRKRNRFITKPAPIVPRRDENKGDVIIMETRDPKLFVHKVTDVPFPFNSVKDYEASIRAPLGNTFIPERAHKKLIRPSVITKAGTVIEPMTEEELLMPRNKSFHNESVIKLLAKK